MKKILLLAASGFVALLGNAQQIPAPLPNTYINDISKTLTPSQLYELNDSILSLEKRSSVQMAILIIPELPAGMEIEDYARAVGNQWGVGHARNGLVYVASLKEHKQRLEVAQNLEGDIPDITAHDITENLKPYLREQDYYNTIKLLITQVAAFVDPVAKEHQRLSVIEADKKERQQLKEIAVVFAWLFGLAAAVYGVYYFLFLPGIRRRRKAEEDARAAQELKEHKEREAKWEKQRKEHAVWLLTPTGIAWQKEEEYKKRKKAEDEKVAAKNDITSSYIATQSNDNSFGNWGGGSSSGDSGFSGGGASNNW